MLRTSEVASTAKGPDAWKPPDQSYWCQYARDWQATKRRWNLDMTVREAAAVKEMTSACQPPKNIATRRSSTRRLHLYF
jgi:hypothetical protein